jgi:hypothetical protein
MSKSKITKSERRLILDLWSRGRRSDAVMLAEKLGVSRNYPCMLYQRSHYPISSRKAPKWMFHQTDCEKKYPYQLD